MCKTHYMDGYRFDYFSAFLVENAKTYYRITDVFSFLNSLCNSDSNPLVHVTIPFLLCHACVRSDRSHHEADVTSYSLHRL